MIAERCNHDKEFLESCKRLNPALRVFSSPGIRNMRWRKEDVPPGYCSLCAKDLLTAEERAKQQYTQLVIELQNRDGIGEEEAASKAKQIMNRAREMA